MKFCEYCMSEMNDSDVKCPVCGSDGQGEIPGHHLLPGTVLNGKYYVGAAIGEGGFGITYVGRDLNLDMKVAIKEYYPNGYVNRANTLDAAVSCGVSAGQRDFFEKGKDRFLKEARILAKFSGSPGIVDVRDFFEANNTAYIVMEYLDGETLREYINRNGTLTPESAVTLLMPVMVSLRDVHRQGLIHRDISPENIMLIDSRVKLLDFGAARDVSNAANKSLSVMLKPGYAPEEQYRSKGLQGPWTDVYALCATLYKCITGITPDDSTQRVFNDEVKRPSELGIVINPNIENAIMRGLSVLQRDRYQTIDELINDLQGINASPVIESNNQDASPSAPIENDFSETIYVSEEEANLLHEELNPVSEEVPVYNPSVPQNRPDFAPKQQAPYYPAQPVGYPQGMNNAPNYNAAPKKPKKKKKGGKVFLYIVLGIVALIAVSTVFKALNTKNISGEKIDKNEDIVSFYDKVLTADDIKALASLGKLEYLKFTYCEFKDNSFEYVGEIPSVLKGLSITECTGISDYSAISKLKYLTDLTIEKCDLTDKQFSAIELKNKDYLTCVDLNGNKSFSDLKKLSEISDSLTQLTVDETSVSDFSALSDCSLLYQISANKCKLTSLSSITNEKITKLYVSGNSINDISAVSKLKYLNEFQADRNMISDIKALSGHKYLEELSLNNNKISDISALSDAKALNHLYLSKNQIKTLSPLSGCKELVELEINNNNLTSLDGLQKAIKLEVIKARDNELSDISGLTNCTILSHVNFNGNRNIKDISVLAKSAKELVYVYFNNNSVTDISALSGTGALKYLSFDNNAVGTLDPLKNSVSLIGISAENNKITSINGLKNSLALIYIYLPHNKITDMSAIVSIATAGNKDFAVLDLSSNNITELKLSSEKSYTYLSVYNNPLKSLKPAAGVSGKYLLFSYIEGEDYSPLKGPFSIFKIVDCPLDKQVEVEKALGNEYVTQKARFQTLEEADKETSALKLSVLTGGEEDSDESETE